MNSASDIDYCFTCPDEFIDCFNCPTIFRLDSDGVAQIECIFPICPFDPHLHFDDFGRED